MSANSKQFTEIVKLPMDITADSDWSLNGLNIRFILQNSLRLRITRRAKTWCWANFQGCRNPYQAKTRARSGTITRSLNTNSHRSKLNSTERNHQSLTLIFQVLTEMSVLSAGRKETRSYSSIDHWHMSRTGHQSFLCIHLRNSSFIITHTFSHRFLTSCSLSVPPFRSLSIWESISLVSLVIVVQVVISRTGVWIGGWRYAYDIWWEYNFRMRDQSRVKGRCGHPYRYLVYECTTVFHIEYIDICLHSYDIHTGTRYCTRHMTVENGDCPLGEFSHLRTVVLSVGHQDAQCAICPLVQYYR